MRHILRFKSFEQATDYALREFYKKRFNPQKTEKFSQEFSREIKNLYKPGIYRFKSFEQARKFDLNQHIKNN